MRETSDTPTTTDAGAAPTVLFTPSCGPVRGRVDGEGDAEVVRASGIPYASAGRFEVPRPLPAWSSIFEADTAAPACPQHPVPVLEKRLGYRTSDILADEDCLRLSVTMPRRTSAEGTPAQGAAATLPVMVC